MRHRLFGAVFLYGAHAILKPRMANEPQNYWQQDPEDAANEAPLNSEDSTPVSPEDTQDFQSQPLAEEDTSDNPPITWSAQEYVHIDKGPWWFIIFGLIVLGFIALDVFFLHAWTLSVLVIVMAIALIIYIRRPPRTLTYALSPKQGLYIGEQLYTFDQFKSFGLIQDGEHHSIMLIPRKRFAPGVSVYFPDEAGERIVDILGARLPMETLKLDAIDLLVRKLRL